MEIEENPNPNSHDTSKSWSDLPQDLLNSVFERLGFADFQRAKSVCSSWLSFSTQCLLKNHIQYWMILFPKHNNKKNKNDDSCCTLFNPEEKDKLYRAKDLGFEEFAKSVCITTYGSWFLMQDPQYNLYIVNLFTKEMINLPRNLEQGGIRCCVFWIDEKTKDYVVVYGRSLLGRLDAVCYFSKKGDDDDNLLWKQISETPGCIHLVYKNHKLYFLSLLGIFKIFDFSYSTHGNPKQVFKCDLYVDRIRFQQLVVSVTKGREVVFKVDLETRKTDLLNRFDSSFLVQFSRARWFLPSFTHS